MLNNETYDVSKWIVLVFLPAIAGLMTGVGEIFSFTYTSETVMTLNLFTAFLGTILQISSEHYHKHPPSGGIKNGSRDFA